MTAYLNDDWWVPFSSIEIGTQIGAGAGGQVFRAKMDGMPCAAKRVPRGMMDDQEYMQAIKVEAEVMVNMHHPNVLSFHGVTRPHDTAAELSDSYGVPLPPDHAKPDVYLVFELMDCSLQDLLFSSKVKYVRARNGCNARAKQRICLQIANGLLYLHHRGVLHRDLKPGNILLSDVSEMNVAKLADFGISTRLEKNRQQDADEELVSDSRHVSVSKLANSDAAVKAAVTQKLADLRELVQQGMLKQEAYDQLFKLHTQQHSEALSASSSMDSSGGQGSSSWYGSKSKKRSKDACGRKSSSGCSSGLESGDSSKSLSENQTFERASKVDSYSYGILFYALSTGQRPYADVKAKNAAHLMRLVVDGQRPSIPASGFFPAQTTSNITYSSSSVTSNTAHTHAAGRGRAPEAPYPQALRDVLEACWHPNPDSRPSMQELAAMLREERVLDALAWQPLSWSQTKVWHTRKGQGQARTSGAGRGNKGKNKAPLNSAATSLKLMKMKMSGGGSESDAREQEQEHRGGGRDSRERRERLPLHCPKRVSSAGLRRVRAEAASKSKRDLISQGQSQRQSKSKGRSSSSTRP